MVHRDLIETGLNTFRLYDTDIETPFQINNCLELLLYVGTNLSLADATEALNPNITLTAAYGSSRNVRRVQII